MNRTVYFADRAVLFTRKAPDAGWHVVALAPTDKVSRAKILNFLELHKQVALVTESPESAFDSFAMEFARVEAAGGVVVNAGGEWLMIHRNGRWDLPKGHWEEGETIEACAAREVEEETGVAARVERLLCTTLHAYFFPRTNRWELKKTHWYELRCEDASRLAPQVEEGIDAVSWSSPHEVDERMAGCFPTVKCVLERLRSSCLK